MGEKREKSGWDSCQVGKRDKDENEKNWEEACDTNSSKRCEAEMRIETGKKGIRGRGWFWGRWHGLQL